MSAPTDRWAPIPSAPGYEASDLGRIRSIDRVINYADGRSRRYPGVVLRADVKPSGYLYVRPFSQNRYVHALVLEAFVGPAPEGTECCHGNGDPTDNRLVNLRWDTPSSNAYDRVRHGNHPRTQRTHCPRGHRLDAPNLVASVQRAGRRSCLACSRGRSKAHYLSARGHDVDVKAITDAYYTQLVAAVKA